MISIQKNIFIDKTTFEKFNAFGFDYIITLK